ncbi:MAG: phosphatase PAP2 family protein [Flavobacteriaceae bacterium]|jgi:membrane-associated phospholipid phosphatase|nr:phosphatase PAP2 family protein [Flavobacteriaceae bacterium]
MHKIHNLFIAVSLLIPQGIFSQNDTLLVTEKTTLKQTVWQNLKYDGLSAFGGVKYTYSRPFHWEERDFIRLTGFVASEVILYSLDTNLDSYFSGQGENVPDWLVRSGWYLGKPQYNYAIIGSIYTFGLLTKNEKIRRTGVLMISSATAAGLLQTTFKTVAGRARPGAGLGKHDFDMFSNKASHHSFPSGHTILSFTLAHALAKQFDNLWIKSGIYAIGSITPLSRMWERAHWATDVFAGMMIGIISVESVDKYLNTSNRYEGSQKDRISWRFTMGVGTVGVTGIF